MMGGNSEVFEMLNYMRSGLVSTNVQMINLEDIPKHMGKFLEFENCGKVVAHINEPLWET